MSRRVRPRSWRRGLDNRLLLGVVLSDAVSHVGLEFSAFLVRKLLEVELEGFILASDAVLHYLVDAHQLTVCQEVYVMTKSLSLGNRHLLNRRRCSLLLLLRLGRCTRLMPLRRC